MMHTLARYADIFPDIYVIHNFVKNFLGHCLYLTIVSVFIYCS
jgi:hypothetical protein